MISQPLDGRAAIAATVVFAAAFSLLACGVYCAPLGVSLVAVLLFAGPHNWLEARYFLGRMPARFGPLAGYSSVAAGGVALLTATFIAYAWAVRYPWCGESMAATLLAVWNSALILWVAGLAEWRRRLPPYRDWPWLWPVALAFLDRELRRSRSVWRKAYRWALTAVPICLAGLAWWGGRAEPLPGDDVLAARLQLHAGADVWPWIPPRVLVSWHAYLELLHYGVWVVAVPALAIGVRPWRMSSVPLARRSKRLRRGLTAAVIAGVGVIIALWAGFAIDYTTTRDIYFTVAVFHVLAEFPMLLRFA